MTDEAMNRYWKTIGVAPASQNYRSEICVRILIFLLPIMLNMYVTTLFPLAVIFPDIIGPLGPVSNMILIGIPTGMFSSLVLLVLYLAKVPSSDIRYSYSCVSIGFAIFPISLLLVLSILP